MRKFSILVVMIVAIAAAIFFYAPGGERTLPSDVVSISSGDLTGIIDTKTDIVSFKGVPFAAAPVGEKRWAPPAPSKVWEGVLEADTYGPSCIQTTDGQGGFVELMADGVGLPRWKQIAFAWLVNILGAPEVNEDCLTLSIFAPQGTTEPLPVMVWYHGGGHRFGAGDAQTYDGTNLAKRGVILVSINYRLGIFGFLAHPELTAESSVASSGNYGTLDQIHALEWVRDNIASFGGDPDNVTIFGESAGAHSVGQVMASPLSKGLVHKAIAQSGIGTHQFLTLKPSDAYPTSAEDIGVKFAAAMGVTGDNQLARLRALPALELHDVFMAEDFDALSHPVVDGHVFPKAAGDLFAQGEQAQIPLMIGSNANEGTLLAPLIGSPFANHKLEPNTPQAYEALVREVYPETADAVLALYPANNDEELERAINALFGDHFFGMQAWYAANETAKQGLPTYLYFFTRKSPAPEQWAGAYHGADIQFVFGSFFPLFPRNDFDQALADQ